MPRFKTKNKEWLSKIFLHVLPQDLVRCELDRVNLAPEVLVQSSRCQSGASFSDPRIDGAVALDEAPGGSSENKYAELSSRHQLKSRKKLQSVIEDEPPQKLIKVFTETISASAKLTKRDKYDLEDVINECIASPNRVSEVKAKLKHEIRPYTAEEALGIMTDRKFTVETCTFLRQDLNSRGSPMFPLYKKVAAARKSCYPSENINVTKVEASVSLQGLLEHTFKRIISLYDMDIKKICEEKGIREMSYVFEGSWGFDGSTGQSLYKQNVPQDLQYD